MTKILMIGNSFGQDSLRYLYGIYRAVGKDVKVVNLYIGGCSLYHHYRNMLSEEKAYSYEINGHVSGLFVSLKEALLSDEWTHIVMQQCSPDSGDESSYHPYLEELYAYVKRLCPPAKVLLNKTWTFAHGIPRFAKTAFTCPEEMFPAITDCYNKAAECIGAYKLIPSGDAMYALYQIYGADIYRDGFHANKTFTRYMLGCVWYMTLTGKPVEGNTFRDFDGEIAEDVVLTVQRVATEAVKNAGYLK